MYALFMNNEKLSKEIVFQTVNYVIFVLKILNQHLLLEKVYEILDRSQQLSPQARCNLLSKLCSP